MKQVLSILSGIFILGCHSTKKPIADHVAIKENKILAFNDPNIEYEGRIGKDSNAATLYWSGSTVRIRFKGTEVKALLEDYNGQNYYNVIVDKNSVHKIKVDTGKNYYTLAANLPAGEHTLELFKRTQIHKEYKRGYTKFYGFHLSDGTVLKPTISKKRRMEFYGNSITCGHAIEDTTGGDSGASMYENNYLSYAAITARHYNAEYSCIAKSGIGVMVSFGANTMPELYNRLNPFDSTSLWDFSGYVPQIVVVDLLQNDAGIVLRPEYEHFRKRFGAKPPEESFIIESYENFIRKIRGHYPKAHIICALGSMDITRQGSKWPGYVEKAVGNLQDKNIYTHFFAYKNTPGHPRVNDQRIMAESLIEFIDSEIKW